MLSKGLVSGLPRTFPSLPLSLAPPCSPCVAGRLRATPHSSSLRPATAPFETLHLDVWGPAPTQGSGRERYFLVVVDDFSRYTTVFPLAKKSEFLDSRDVRFDKSVSYYTRYPCRGLPVPPPPLFLAPSPPAPAPPVPPPPLVLPRLVCPTLPLYPRVARQVASPSPQSSSQSPQQPLALPRQVTVDSVVLGLEVQPLAVLGLGALGRGVLAQVALALGVLELEVLAQVALALGVLELEVLAQAALALGVLELEVLALVVLILGVLELEVLALEVLVLGTARRHKREE
ncbi:unnamed protein product [Closterium sp. NIES-64]|nr:unnamed protein product [Closterium sp. NIES-64]